MLISSNNENIEENIHRIQNTTRQFSERDKVKMKIVEEHVKCISVFIFYGVSKKF